MTDGCWWLWLSYVLGPGAAHCRRLLDVYGSAREVFEAVGREDLSGLLSVVSDGGQTYTVLGADLVDLTDEIQTQFPDLNPAMIEDASTGRWANFSVQSGTDGDGSDLFFTGSAMLEGREIPYDWYAAEITAAISYENGIFTLSDFHLNSLS